MKLINNETVSHISVYKEREGVWHTYNGWTNLFYLPYRKHKWYEFDKETKEGYYEDGVNGSFSMFRSANQVNSTKGWFIKGSSVFTYETFWLQIIY